VQPAISDQARKLALEHRKSDPELFEVYVAPGADEVRMVEVSKSAYTTREVIPFRFGARPESELPFDTVMVLLSLEELQLLRDEKLELPEGWGEFGGLILVYREDDAGG
jgi:hypothetical protein